jgi:hypothetical protein
MAGRSAWGWRAVEFSQLDVEFGRQHDRVVTGGELARGHDRRPLLEPLRAADAPAVP